MKKLWIFSYVCLFLFAIISLMDTWGSLSKTQDDPTTIDQAIDAKIAAHLGDPSAHLATGASLQNHRQNDVLDHPAGSALGDKETMSELYFDTFFENLSAFGSAHASASFPGVRLIPIASGSANRAHVEMDGESHNLTLDFSKDFCFTFSFQDTGYSTHDFQAALRWGAVDANFWGVGLKIVNNVASFFLTKESGISVATLSWPSYTDTTPYIVRIQNVASESKIYVYINGELLGTMDTSTVTDTDPLSVTFQYWYTSGAAYETDVFRMTLVMSP